MKLAYLGGLTAQQFLREYLQKKPSLTRHAFLDFGDALTSEELADLTCEEDATAHPVQISPQMIAKVSTMLKSIRWEKADVALFLGEYLTEPEPHIIFTPPRRMTREVFGARLAKQGLMLDLKSQILLSGNNVFINGESVEVNSVILSLMERLAELRSLPPMAEHQAIDLLHQWHQAGYLQLKGVKS